MTPAAKLLKWYRRHGRDLPWRKTRDPYRILVSEVMLQQTQVARVLAYYDRWLARFPDWRALAEASNAEVIHAWAGLGYNRRALMLRDIARQVAEHGEPDTRDGWQALKGIGPYTAAAIAAFAHEQRVMPIDTNIRRVLSRLLLGKAYPDPKDDSELERRMDAFLPRRGAYHDVPQAVFDLAAGICKKTPDCASCPLKDDCAAAEAFLSGKVTAPKAMIKKANERRHRDKPHPDRIYRGRILALARDRTRVPVREVGPAVDEDYDPIADEAWIEAMIGRLADDRLLTRTKTHIRLA